MEATKWKIKRKPVSKTKAKEAIELAHKKAQKAHRLLMLKNMAKRLSEKKSIKSVPNVPKRPEERKLQMECTGSKSKCTFIRTACLKSVWFMRSLCASCLVIYIFSLYVYFVNFFSKLFSSYSFGWIPFIFDRNHL